MDSFYYHRHVTLVGSGIITADLPCDLLHEVKLSYSCDPDIQGQKLIIDIASGIFSQLIDISAEYKLLSIKDSTYFTDSIEGKIIILALKYIKDYYSTI